MGNPVISIVDDREIGWNTITMKVYVWGAAHYMKKTLLQDAKIHIEHKLPSGETRILSHIPGWNTPLKKLPWPLSKVQQHSVNLMTMDNNEEVGEGETFQKSQIDDAIRQFLAGLNPEGVVEITVTP